MKMNAKKLTVVLVALLLALTCVFAACNKTTEPVVNGDGDKEDAATVDPVISREDAEAVAKAFKAEYQKYFLDDLYTSATKTDLDAAKAETLINIVKAADKKAAEDLANAFIEELKKAPTLVDEVKALIKAIDKVSPKDAADFKTLKAYNDALLAATAATEGARKDLLDAYKADAETQKAIADIEARLAVLDKAAKAADAEGGVNAKIADTLAKFQAEDAVFNLAAHATLQETIEKIDAFAAEYDIEAGSDAYNEIVEVADFEAAKKLFNDGIAGNEEIEKALKLVDLVDDLEAAAAAAQYHYYAWVDGDNLISEDEKTFIVDYAKTIATKEDGYVKISVFPPYNFGSNETRYVKPADIYATIDEADTAGAMPTNIRKAELAGYDVAVITEDGETMYAPATYETEDEAKEAEIENAIKVELVNVPKTYKLALKADVDAAKEAAEAWFKLVSQEAKRTELGYYAKTTAAKTVKNSYEKIMEIVGDYEASLAAAKAEFEDFKQLIVVENYVDVYPEKEVTFDTRVLTTSTTKEGWQATSKDKDGNPTHATAEVDEFANSLKRVITKENGKKLTQFMYEKLWGEEKGNTDNAYALYKIRTYKLPSTDALKGNYEVGQFEIILKDGVPAVNYTIWIYTWEIDGVTVTPENTEALDAFGLLYNNAATQGLTADEQAEAFLLWVDKYIGADYAEATFDLTDYEIYKDAVKKTGYVLTFEDYKAVEVPQQEVMEADGKEVTVEPSEALDITVYADVNVAKAIVAEKEKIDAAKKEALEALEDAVKAIFTADSNNAIGNARALYDGIVNGEYLFNKLYADREVDDAALAYLAQFETEVIYEDGEPTDETVDVLRHEVLLRAKTANKAELKADCITVIEEAEAILALAKTLAPAVKFETELSGVLEAYTTAEANLDKMNEMIDAYGDLLDAATEDEAYKHAGNKVGRNGEELISDAVHTAAENLLKKLTAWDFILEDATQFIINNKNATAPALLAALEANTVDEAAVKDEIYAAFVELLNAIGENDEETLADADALATYMARVAVQAKSEVEYTASGDVTKSNVTVFATLDKEALEAKLAAAKTALVEKFEALAEYQFTADDIEAFYNADAAAKFDDLRAVLYNFAAAYETDYINLKVTYTFEETEIVVDYLSKFYEEKLLLEGYRIITEIRSFAIQKVGTDNMLITIVEDAGITNKKGEETTWKDAALERIAVNAQSYTVTSLTAADAYVLAAKGENFDYTTAANLITDYAIAINNSTRVNAAQLMALVK